MVKRSSGNNKKKRRKKKSGRYSNGDNVGDGSLHSMLNESARTSRPSSSSSGSRRNSVITETDGNKQSNAIFISKLQGARARLFAAGCLRYLGEASCHWNDRPIHIPVFSGLSAHQRIHLVKEVMVGLLCENEPLPHKPEHFVAYLAVHDIIEICLVAEIDYDDGTNYHEDDPTVEEVYETCPVERGTDDDDDDGDEEESGVTRMRNEIEDAEEYMNNLLRGKVASRVKKKMKKQLNAKHDGDDNDHGRTNECESEGIGGGDDDDDDTNDTNDSVNREVEINRIKNLIFAGGPQSEASRQPLRPILGTPDSFAYEWRILCEDAFREHTELKFVNFNWKSCNMIKWREALSLYKIGFGILTTASKQKYFSLHYGRVDDKEYANPKKYRRIMYLRNTMMEWRESYEENWDPSQLSLDHRCIVAVCWSDFLYDEETLPLRPDGWHSLWSKEFCKECKRRGLQLGLPGKYQARLEIFRKLENFEVDALYHPYRDNSELKYSPSDYEDRSMTFDFDYFCTPPGRTYERCHKCWSTEKSSLSKCSRCKVVKYCSRKCQVADWPEHKMCCKSMASMQKDKRRMMEICKGTL